MALSTRTFASRLSFDRDHPHYKWIVLSNTTLGMLVATINASILIISLPDIFRGLNLDPLSPGNVSYLLWMLMGFLLVTAVLVVTLGRLGDIYGRVRIYNLGFVVFTIGSVALAIDPFRHGSGALWIILWRVVQGVGAAMLFANATAILTDAFPANRRGFALGINQVAAIAGSFIGLILGGLLAPIDWRLVFFVSVPFGLLGTLWSYHSLRETSRRSSASIDWTGNVLFAGGLTALLAAITYGIQPYGGHNMGWTNPWILAGLAWYIIALAPLSGITQAGNTFFSDRFVYLPQIGVFIAGSLCLASLCSRIRHGATLQLPCLALATVAYGATTHWYARQWKDTATLFTHATSVTKNNFIAHTTAALAFVRKGDLPAAIPHFEAGLRINPGALNFRSYYGQALASLGRDEEAASQFKAVIARDPQQERARFSLAAMQLRLDQPAEALANLRILKEHQFPAPDLDQIIEKAAAQAERKRSPADGITPP